MNAFRFTYNFTTHGGMRFKKWIFPTFIFQINILQYGHFNFFFQPAIIIIHPIFKVFDCLFTHLCRPYHSSSLFRESICRASVVQWTLVVLVQMRCYRFLLAVRKNIAKQFGARALAATGSFNFAIAATCSLLEPIVPSSDVLIIFRVEFMFMKCAS